MAAAAVTDRPPSPPFSLNETALDPYTPPPVKINSEKDLDELVRAKVSCMLRSIDGQMKFKQNVFGHYEILCAATGIKVDAEKNWGQKHFSEHPELATQAYLDLLEIVAETFRKTREAAAATDASDATRAMEVINKGMIGTKDC